MVQILTGPRFARALRAGALAVVREQETLNRINVFPVPDADTGFNLASTLRSAASALQAPRGVTVGQTVRVAADAALDGARGNSGAILAQFLHGLAEGIGSRVHVTTHEFAAAARHGVDGAEMAMQNPVEGTILSVLRAWAQALDEHSRAVHDFGELLRHGLDRAQQALAYTPKQLAVLAKNGVVDAGAQGFVYFLEGISTFFRDRKAADWRNAGLSPAATTPFAAAHADLDLTYRFCSEGLLVGERLDRKAVAAAVRPLGGSLVVAGGGSRLRVHLHTNEPQKMFGVLAGFGVVERTKIDDMVLQQLAARNSKIALVSDSSCDLAESTAHALGLVRVPLQLAFGNETFSDGVDITAAQFYQRLASSAAPAKTSQPSVGEFRSTFQRLLEHHEGVVCVSLSSGLSGTYQAAAAAAKQVDPKRIRVIDSRHVSVGLALVAEAVGEAIAAGAGLDNACDVAHKAVKDVRLFTTFPSYETAVRGGRVKPSVARIAKTLGLKPVLVINEVGAAVKAGVRFGFAGSLRALAAKAKRFAGDRPVRLMVAHANAVGAAEYVTEQLCRRFGQAEIPIVNVAPVLAAHAGPGAVAVAVRRLDA